MPKRVIGMNVFDAAHERLTNLYSEGHRLVVSFSGGKDSGVALEMCVKAAEEVGRLPVDVIMRDEEIMFPGTFEYCERVYARPEIDMHWVIANQPIINIFNREIPYFWTFDPLLNPEEWVRQPPEYAYKIPHPNIEMMTVPERFPPEEGKELIAVLGLRASESRGRNMGIQSAKSCLTQPNSHGVRNMWPIYDMRDGDIWKALYDNGWDFNEAYTVMYRLGLPKNRLRIAPPSMTTAGLSALSLAMKAWPAWFDKVSVRLPGIRSAAMYGRRACEPIRRLDETWEGCFKRTCINEAPAWIAERATRTMETTLEAHSKHSNTPMPESTMCGRCKPIIGSWRGMAKSLYMGDPFSMKDRALPYCEPEQFRDGAGTWGGKPAF